ncbi:MAG: multicopper oxidase domain-containing protein [Streptomycetaceae bacterium]|nr:multicopper oxidase domain-containing protein [Streptomycetaceae bacterium]
MRALLRFGGNRRALRAFAERQEMVKAGLSRRDLVRLGLMTGSGLLVTERGMTAEARADDALGTLPPLEPFVEPLPILPVLEDCDPATDPGFAEPPTADPNRATNPATSMPFEGRSEAHQSRGPGQPGAFEPEHFKVTHMGANPNAVVHPDLPEQTLWGFNLGGADLTADPPLSPGPVLVLNHLEAALIRRYNDLPPVRQNGGFGVPEVSTHLHNFHSAPDSDGGPCDPVQQRFFYPGQYYDYFHSMRFAGWNSTSAPDGDIRETLGFLWYHDHRVDHTAENTYKGLVGPAIVFGEDDTGDESTGLHLPGFVPDGGFDIPLVFGDRLFDPATGLLAFDTFNTDGILGNVFLVNGKAQPFFEVSRRRYRFRLLDAGPSRFYQFFLTNPDDLSQSIPFLVISSDGNLLGRPIKTTSVRMGVAERNDIVVDFARIAREFGNPARLILENRLEQTDGRGPTGTVLPAGRGDALLEFRIGAAAGDDSFDYDPLSAPGVLATAGDSVFGPIVLPDVSAVQPRITRSFRFERGDGGWQVNGQFMDCTRFRFTAQRNAFERWILHNDSGGWQHPIHIHLEEFRIVRRNGVTVKPGDVEFGRKDVMQLRFNNTIELLIRFRDMVGGYPFHCHNTVHEDHQMMMLFDVADVGDDKTTP